MYSHNYAKGLLQSLGLFLSPSQQLSQHISLHTEHDQLPFILNQQHTHSEAHCHNHSETDPHSHSESDFHTHSEADLHTYNETDH